MGTRWVLRLVATLAACAMAASPGSARAMPTHLIGALGSSLAASGEPSGGGPALSLTALWPFDDGFEAGVMVFVDDIGNQVRELRDANDPSIVLGASQQTQRLSFGAAWRVDAVRRGNHWEPYASVTLGYYRVQRDRLGVVMRAESANGASLGVGLRRRIGPDANLGLSVRYHQLTSDDLERYMQVTLDGGVRWGR